MKGGSRQFSTRDVASQTKLKFRQAGQGGTTEVQKRDLRAELLKAEADAKARKRKAAGLVDDMDVDDPKPVAEIEDRDPDEVKRRKLLQAVELDKDDDEEEETSGVTKAQADRYFFIFRWFHLLT